MSVLFSGGEHVTAVFGLWSESRQKLCVSKKSRTNVYHKKRNLQDDCLCALCNLHVLRETSYAQLPSYAQLSSYAQLGETGKHLV